MQKWNTIVDMIFFSLDSPVSSTLLVGCGSTVVVEVEDETLFVSWIVIVIQHPLNLTHISG